MHEVSTRSPAPAGIPVWHALEPHAAERALDTSRHGLGVVEVAARLAHHGLNRLEQEPSPPRIVVLLRQFRSPLIYILLVALAVTLMVGERIDAGVIGVVLALNAVIGFSQERRAEGAVRALMKLVSPRARVIRDGEEWEIDSAELVPGDLVLLEPGTRVPADMRLIQVNGLRADESLLTGESTPVSKRLEAVALDAPLADRVCMAYTGAVVTSGRGCGLVVATGPATELGAVAGLMRAEEETATPLQERMDSFGRLIGVVVAMGSLVAFASGLALGEPAQDMFLAAVALAVSAVPEGLPVVVTITLAVGVHRMARRHAIIRRLPAVEALGSTTVIGSDKTGTLTENRMTVRTVWTPGHGYDLVGEPARGEFLEGDEPAALDDDGALHLALLAGVLTNEAAVYRRNGRLEATGDPTEVALLTAAMSAGIEPDEARAAYPMFAEIPFEPEQRYSASVRSRHGRHVVFVKGAPERLARMCTRMLGDRGVVPLDARALHAAAGELAGRGLRVLALAYRSLPDERDAIHGEVSEPNDLILLGLVGMMDPPRPGVREAVAACHEAGIHVVMITGDHAATARSIAESLGIVDVAADGAQVVTGADLVSVSEAQLGPVVGDVSVFARVSPEDKLRIVNALQARGDIVAVTGDGVNDAPALKAAQIGVAMGRDGTDVAREAADMVLTDDNFVSITAAVHEGRVTFDNIRKATFFLLSTGAAEMAAILFGIWAGWPLLMLPAQLLWLNLVTNGLQDVALAFEPGERGILRRPPRPPSEGVLSRVLWERTALAGLVIAAGTLLMFRYQLDTTGSLEQARTAALTTMVIFQTFQAGNARSETVSLFRMNPISNPFLFVAAAAALAIHAAAIYLPPTQYVLRVEPIGLDVWILIVAVAASLLVAMEAHKALRHRWRTMATT